MTRQSSAAYLTSGGYAEEVKAAVLAALMLGEPVKAVARAHGVSPATVRKWRGAAGIRPVEPVVSEAQVRDIGLLIGRYLAAGLEALTAQARVASDPEWIRKQPADQLAILHGVLNDKLVRILAAMETGAAGSGDIPIELPTTGATVVDAS